MQKLYKSRHTSDLWSIANYNQIKYCTGGGSTLICQMGANFWYFNLFHNKELQSALKQISNRSTNIKNRGTIKDDKTKN